MEKQDTDNTSENLVAWQHAPIRSMFGGFQLRPSGSSARNRVEKRWRSEMTPKPEAMPISIMGRFRESSWVIYRRVTMKLGTLRRAYS